MELNEILKKLREAYEDDESVSDTWDLVDDDAWAGDGKYLYRSRVFFVSEYDVHVCISESRSGSHFTDWYYGSKYFTLVSPETKTITVVNYNYIAEAGEEEIKGD